MSNATISKLRSILKGRNTDGCKTTSKKQLEDLPMPIPIQRPKKPMFQKDL